MTENIIPLTIPKSDEDIASEIRTEIHSHLEAVAMVMNKAGQYGMRVEFSVQPSGFGRFSVSPITISKQL